MPPEFVREAMELPDVNLMNEESLSISDMPTFQNVVAEAVAGLGNLFNRGISEVEARHALGEKLREKLDDFINVDILNFTTAFDMNKAALPLDARERLNTLLKQLFELTGIGEINPEPYKEKFTPHLHELVEFKEAAPTESAISHQTIIDVQTRGFYRDNKILKKARVVVAK